jgi:hypothetical protein
MNWNAPGKIEMISAKCLTIAASYHNRNFEPTLHFDALSMEPNWYREL